jgi:hypothetical protein
VLGSFGNFLAIISAIGRFAKLKLYLSLFMKFQVELNRFLARKDLAGKSLRQSRLKME